MASQIVFSDLDNSLGFGGNTFELLDTIAFLIHKRYIPDPEQFNHQRFKCAAQMREPL
jgi:hypothetical protein